MTDAIQISENTKYYLKSEKILNDFLQIFENVSNYQEIFQIVRAFGGRMVKCWIASSTFPRPSARSLENVQNFWYNEYRK